MGEKTSKTAPYPGESQKNVVILWGDYIYKMKPTQGEIVQKVELFFERTGGFFYLPRDLLSKGRKRPPGGEGATETILQG